MSKPLRVLIVEDSENDMRLIVRELQRNGYDPTFERVETNEAMKAALDKQVWDIIIADYSMPRFSAPEALKLLHESGLGLPFIIVSGTIGEEVAVASLKAGANDYLMKGNLKRLAPAVERELREAASRRRRKQTEEALRQSEEKLRLMFDSISDGIIVADLDGVITEVNKRFLEIHEVCSRDSVLGKSVFEFISPHDHERIATSLRRTPEQGSIKNIEPTFVKADGSEFLGELSTSVLRNASGNPLGFIAITRNISEHRKMEEQLIVTDRLASIGELASGIAHELNNPLTSVIGFSQLLLERDIPDEAKKDLKIVYSEAQRAAEVVKNLLTFARKHLAVKQLVNINTIIQKVLELRAYEQKVNNILVNTQLASDLPEIMGDYFQLQQVFFNIIINAEYFMVEAHKRGTLIIITGRVESTARVIFMDDGPGIPPENLGHVFDPFFTTKEVGKGTGLGLSICHGIVTEHGGRIYVESELGKGSTFIVELPIISVIGEGD